jgi:hypothetical protein
MEAAHNPKTFDRGDFLAWAVALFQQKERWRGQQPNTARVHPDDFGNGLRLTAEALGLAMLSDPTVTAGTYRLGLVEKREQGNVTCCNHCAEV